jgi:hypothetical protein
MAAAGGRGHDSCVRGPWLLACASALACQSLALPAAAQERPVVVEYDAPSPECPSLAAFRARVELEVARFPAADRKWRWSLHIRPEKGGYTAALVDEDEVRTLTAPSCDEVSAAAALAIAGREPPPPSPAPSVPPAARPPPEWRLGLRGETSNHGVDGASLSGVFGVGSVELPFGLRKTMFELALGGMWSQSGGIPMSYLVVDTQTCLLDLPLGDGGLSLLGCLRLAGASFKTTGYGPPSTYASLAIPQTGGALWTGVGARLRWQTKASLFFEGAVEGVYGTISGGESLDPGWVDATLSAGFQL